MKKIWVFGVACAAFASSDAAVAADAVPPTYKAPPVAQAFSWTGIYLGAHFGGAFQQTTFDDPFFANLFPGPAIRSMDFSGFFGGQQAGWNYQIGNLVVGNEFEFSWSHLNGSRTDVVSITQAGLGLSSDTRTITAKTDWFGTGTARLGFAWDRLLIYSKGGAAWARFNYGIDDAAITIGGPVVRTSFAGRDTRVGWTVGAGLEWAFWNNLSAKVEYDYLAFSNRPVTLNSLNPAVGPAQIADTVEHAIQTVKVGLNWHLAASDTPWGSR